MKDNPSSAPPEDQAQKAFSPPTISLPKGGGAIRGIGEKFAANPVTGTGSMSVPIAASPGRSGFGPQLSLSYDSGSGNGPFGFGWSLSIPAITRKTDKGLPRYWGAIDSDIFLLSGAEDLVPVYKVDDEGQWVINEQGNYVFDEFDRDIEREDGPETYRVRRYRPRVEGLFARIERWTRSDGDVHWRSITRDNILTLYGQDANSRIADPNDPQRVFSWLICETRDDKGNAILYEYVAENGAGVDLSQVNERNRGPADSPLRQANRYLKRIRYGNRTTLLNEHNRRPTFLTTDNINAAEWMFELVFDYGEGRLGEAEIDDQGRQFITAQLEPPGGAGWPVRQDPFSSCRAGFEVRTYRLCRRVLMFHHFPGADELGRPDYLARSTDFTYRENPIASFVTSISHSSYLLQPEPGNPDRYMQKSLPPLEFEYSQVPGAEELARLPVYSVEAESLENLPYGLDGNVYQWVDLDNEGLSGILTEQGASWFYKRNLSPTHLVPEDGRQRIAPRFGPLEQIPQRPSAGLSTGAQFLDLAGDGQVDLVQMEGPLRGFYERTDDGWASFQPFTSWPNLDPRNSNLKFIDLTGDGHADILITEEEVFTWHLSQAEEGFGPAQWVRQATDEEHGPRLVFADGTQTIHLADLSGDGLTDLVRIRNGEVCYWPNLGYGRFGAKVTMDQAPFFDAPDMFDPSRLRLADIDGSGVTDILYLRGDGVQIYSNQSGNSWSTAAHLPQFPRVDNLASVQALDLLGNGTACLVWSSPLPGEAHTMRYIDLMRGEKPHLLNRVKNNLGAETSITYAPSTRFYLADKLAGRPWITRLPFPVHVVEGVAVIDKWRETCFTTAYSYHHGYFDGPEREFRGFGRVEQLDVEAYGKFRQCNAQSASIADDEALYQPPVKTVTWFHTGAFLDRERILSQFEQDYFPRWFEDLNPGVADVLGEFKENILPQPDLAAGELDGEEWRQALRACKGMTLRQEVYELDPGALEHGEHRPVKLFSTAYHNAHIQRLQPRGGNPHAVFLVTESEAITYHYELDLRTAPVSPDPRLAHTLNLKTDEYGNILQAAAVVYPRLGRHLDPSLPDWVQPLIIEVQGEQHLVYTETRYTEDVLELDDYRLRLPCEVLTYELTGVGPRDEGDAATDDVRDDRYFTLDELRRYRLSDVHQTDGLEVPEIPYHALPNRVTPQKRLVEHARSLFFGADLAGPLRLGQLSHLGLPYESYKLALTDELLRAILTPERLTAEVQLDLSTPQVSGYISGSDLGDAAGQYWVCSGVAGFAGDAARHFYLPERYTDPFGNITELEFDDHDLYLKSSKDPLDNMVEVKRFDFRVLAPQRMQDINGNFSEVRFDVLGLPAAMAVLGKEDEADSLVGFTDVLLHPGPDTVTSFFTADYSEAEAQRLLGTATARHLYSFGGRRGADGSYTQDHPACAAGIMREVHASQLAPDEPSPVQVAIEYSDGGGNVLVKKVQAEPEEGGTLLRWIENGRTILNNKGKPVKQYEPDFSPPHIGHRYAAPRLNGVTPVMYYDAPGRLVRTELPDGAYSRVAFSPWHVTSYDPNDTVLEEGNAWYARRMALPPGDPGRRAAELAAEHANTPARVFLDSLGREVISVAHNKYHDLHGVAYDENYPTFTRLDAEGKPLWIVDPRQNRVMQYITPFKPDEMPETAWIADYAPCYGIAGNLLFQHSMDAGDRWMLPDAAGQPMYAWDSLGRTIRTDYDPLRRPIRTFVSESGGTRLLAEGIVYGEGHPEAIERNLRRQIYSYFDGAGVQANEQFDFKGNLLRNSRTLARDPAGHPDWSPVDAPAEFDPEHPYDPVVISAAAAPLLDDEIFTSRTEYDALNRPVLIVTPHTADMHPNYVRPGYNKAGLLEWVNAWLQQIVLPAGLPDPTTANLHAVKDIGYNARGQRDYIVYGNDVRTEYTYDPQTFRLIHLLTLGAGRRLQDLSYTYDPSGNITAIQDDAQQEVFFDNHHLEPHSQYVYDALYRLVEAHGREHAVRNNFQRDHEDFYFDPIPGIPFPNSPEAMQSYTEAYLYDPAGNILSMQHIGGDALRWTRRYQYSAFSNRLVSTSAAGEADAETYIDPDGPARRYGQKYGYNVHGSMTAMPHLPEMIWDYKEQLVRAVRLDGTAVDFTYDATGQRVRKHWRKSGGVVEERIYLGGFEVYREHSGAGPPALERQAMLLIDGEQRIAMIDTRTAGSDAAEREIIRYQLGNHLGSAALELDGEGAIITYEEYHPYGTTAYQAGRSETEVNRKRYRYTGMERDRETGLSYHAARYYAPWLGRWISSDPINLLSGMNFYAYTKNNPVSRVDLSGYQHYDPATYTSGGEVPVVTDPGDVGERPHSTPQDLDIATMTVLRVLVTNPILDLYPPTVRRHLFYRPLPEATPDILTYSPGSGMAGMAILRHQASRIAREEEVWAEGMMWYISHAVEIVNNVQMLLPQAIPSRAGSATARSVTSTASSATRATSRLRVRSGLRAGGSGPSGGGGGRRGGGTGGGGGGGRRGGGTGGGGRGSGGTGGSGGGGGGTGGGRPRYEANPAHLPGPLYNPEKTPEPPDAGAVFESAIESTNPRSSGVYWGMGANGEIYRFSRTDAGTYHFSAMTGPGGFPMDRIPIDVRRRLGRIR